MSGRIRTEIGLAKKRLKDALDADLVTVDSLKNASLDIVYDEIIESVDLAATLRTEKERILQLHQRWVTLSKDDPAEQQQMDSYKSRLGDYMESIQPVAEQLTLLEQRYTALCTLHRSRSSSPEEYPVFDLSTPPAPTTPLPESTAMGKPLAMGQAVESSTVNAMGKNMAMGHNMENTTAMGTDIPPTTITLPPIPTSPTILPPTIHTTLPPQYPHPAINPSLLHPIQPTTEYRIINASHGINVTLSSIKLPTFNGNHLEYASFMDLFFTLIGQKNIDDVVKMQYLMLSLEGDAKALVQYLPITSENFSHALSILRDNYGDTYRTRHHLLRQLHDLPSVAFSKSTKDVKAFWTKATITLNQLKNIYPDCDNTTTADILIQKLPRFYISKLFGSGMYQEFIASQLLLQLHRLIQADQLVSTIYNHPVREEKVTTMAAHTKHQHPRQREQQAVQESRRTSAAPSSPCVFCASQEHYHRHHDCPTYRTANERHQRARELRLCFKCLRQHDDYRSCPRTPKCRICEGTHQTSFCKHHTTPLNTEGPRHSSQFSQRQSPAQQTTTSSRPPQRPSQGQYSNNRGNVQSNNFQMQPFAPRQQQQPFRPHYQPGGQNRFNPQQQQQRNTTNVAFTQEHEFDNSETSFTATVTEHCVLPVDQSSAICFSNDKDNDLPLVHQTSKKPVAMMATQILVDDKDGNPVQATVLFDNGSDRSFISSMFVEKLDLPWDSEQSLCLQTFGDSSCKAIETRNFSVNFTLNDEKRSIKLTEIPFITAKLNCVQLTESHLPHLMGSENLVLPRIQSQPDILIGLDSMYRILGSTTSKVLPNGMTMHQTDCGVIITGQELFTTEVDVPDIEPFRSSTFFSTNNNAPLGILQTSPDDVNRSIHNLLEFFWTVDNTGTMDSTITNDEEQAHQFYLHTTFRQSDGRYVVRWPYKESPAVLPDNRFLAYFRLQSTIKRLEKDDNLLQQYNDIILDQLKRKFIEFVDDESKADGDVVQYLSHHPVIKVSSKSTKCRIVFDASARINKQSKCLNDVLHTGMSLLPQIPGVLLRIRCFPILISGDIEKAFLQLGLDIRDRDACRFLWKFPGEKKISCLRFMVVPFGVKTSPYLLNETIKHHLQLVDNELCRSILRNVYVDNIFMGVSSTTEGKAVYHDSKELFHDAQMRLTQFFSNSKELNTYMAEQEDSPAEGAEQKILGVQWNTCTDQFGLKLPPPIQNQLTKRRILQTIATAYDPLGILAPVILLGKLFFQKLWMRTRDWDSPLSEEEIVEWTSIENKWKGPQINFGRQYFTTPISPADKLELHVFSDASDGAYGAVAYLRRLSDTCNESTILSSKSRLSPVKKTYSIPQKELLGIEKAAQLATFIMKEMEFSFTNCYVWSDSLCSVDQLATNKASTTFSRNRLRKIKELLPSGIFSHVPGKNNPADLVSRGCSLQELHSNELWWKGPPFLQSQDPLPIRESSLQNAICNLTIAMPEVLEPIICKDNGIWYFEGRQPSHNVPYLPHGPTAKLLILEIHQKHHHSSTLYTLSKVREEAWIAQGNSFVKRTLKGCLHCKRNTARPYYQPDFPPLPDMRITWSKPFTYVGMDYCGPVKATNNGETRQFWFLLFTCLTSRFTSVELVSSMDTRTLLNAVRRIAAQHGSPQLIYTDNAAQIKLLEKVVSEARNQQRCLSLASNDLPIFKFIPALSPWSGGIYERVVGIFKKCLVQAGTTRSLLTEDDLRTLMKEAESIINDRPLTTTSPDMTDLHPLRPSDFVTPNKQRRSLLNIEETLDTLPLPVSQASLLDDWMRLSSLSQHFISRWNTEYLQMLQGRYQTEHHQSHLNKHSMPRVGDIVLIDETGPFGKTKGNWPLAKIVKVDSRSALLRNSRTNEIVERPFKKIIPLELSAPVPMESKSSNSSSTTHSDQPPNPNDPIASRTRSRTPGLTALAITMVALLSLTSVQAVETTSNASSPVMNPPSSTVPGLNIEDAYAISTSLLQEIATRLGYTVLLFGLVAILYCVSILIQVSTLLSSLFSILLKVFRSTLWWIRRIVCLPFSRTPPLVPS
ncbi:hypothetical protein CRE_09915 [Caenorhabditis remanei]|uniref:Integrase catalytic domain-containing protein n=1 Tax=Caenorhabditis remanei TaxID=31234 RepID=E3NQT3_CAERE|nr:hypothetical protein CRE_09915 [Caenorhabditis remanei]